MRLIRSGKAIKSGILIGSLVTSVAASAQTVVLPGVPPGMPVPGVPTTAAQPSPQPSEAPAPIPAQSAAPAPFSSAPQGGTADGTAAVPGASGASGPSSLPRGNAEYKLGPGDLIEVSVFGIEEYRHNVRISATGAVKLPLIEPVTASGLTAAELEAKLADLLGGEVIKNPQVSVFVKEYRSQPVYVLGAVQRPGQYQITMQMRVVDAIAMAGGAQPTACDEVTIQRPLASGGEQTITVDLAKIVETGDLKLNVVVQGGDVINVKARPVETVYVVGEVQRAGAFTKTPKQDIRVTQAIAWAGGPQKTASLSKGVLVRYNDAGQRQEMPLDIKAIFNGKSPDFLVKANDVIFIPGSTMKSLGYGVLATVPSSLVAIPYAVIP